MPFANPRRFMSASVSCALLAGCAVSPSASVDTTPLSAATKRALALGYDEKGPEWFVAFRSFPLTGVFAFDPDIVRRDPSAIIQVDGLYHVWFTRSAGPTAGESATDPNAKVWPWDLAEVWHATSRDGLHWENETLAVARGTAGAFDDRSVLTPEILAHGGRYYLVYQAIKGPYTSRIFEQVAMAVADNPFGPWTKLPQPILEPERDGQWKGAEDNRAAVHSQGSFDSHKVHDPTLMVYRGKFYLYYKGERMGERMNFGGRQINWGVAIADQPTGPYRKSEYNPITNSGHELAIWPYRGGMAALLTTDGPERDTVQWAADGINFEIMAHIVDPPQALGIYRDPRSENAHIGLTWGLHHIYRDGGNQIMGYRVVRRIADESGSRSVVTSDPKPAR